MKDIYSEWDNAAEWYDQNMGETGDQHNKAVIRPVVLQMLGDIEGKTLLDAGCGSGYVAAELAGKAREVWGTDFSANFVRICQKKYREYSNLHFKTQDVSQRLEFADGTFDAVLCKMVLQYVPELETFARESQRVLADRGKLVVVVDHPMRALLFHLQSADKTPAGPAAPPAVFSGEPQTKLSLWKKVELTWYARPVSAYLQPFIAAGLTLTDIQEPVAEANGVIIPAVLACTFVKNGASDSL